MADSEPKDFKAVKVQFKGSQKSGETLSRSMLYSGINIFGQLSQLYLQSKESGQSYSAFSEQIGKGSKTSGGEDGGSMLSLNQEILAIFKRLQKKDSTTKIKAFQELERYVDSLDAAQGLNQSMASEDFSAQSQSDEIQNLLTFFLYHFCRILTNEPDRKVREAAHMTLAAFIRKAKRRLGPHLKRIFSLWFCSFFDVSQEVALLARKNFEGAFPEAKREQVFKIAYKNFLHFANEQLKQSEDQISENVADLSKVQREEVFDRITGSVLLALAKSFEFTKDWSEDERIHFNKKLVDILDLTAPPADQMQEESKKPAGKKQQHQSYLWNFLQPKYRGRVRAACLQFISSLLINIPKELIEGQMSLLAPGVHNMIAEDNSQIQNTLWKEALFTLGKNFPTSWEQTNIKKNFLPKLYTCLKSSAFGSPLALYENFVKFVSIFPLYHIVDYSEDKVNKASFKERASLLRETLTTLYQGLKNDESVAFHQDLTKCYFETFAFLVLKRVQPLIANDKASQEDKDFAILQLKKCIQLPLEDFINNYEKFQSKVQNQRNIRATIPNQISKFLKDISDRGVDQKIYTSITEYMLESILVAPEKYNIIRVFSALFKSGIQKESSYFNEGLVSGFILQFLKNLDDKITTSIDNLSKDNIDEVISKSNQVQKTLYKINKYKVDTQISEISQVFKAVSEGFIKVAKKEEMASKVLSQDVLAKFKTLKDSLLNSVILCQNLLGAQSINDLKNLLHFIFETKSIDSKLKIKTLMPSQTFKKIDFNKYFQIINEQEIHDLILNYIIKSIVSDEKAINQNWSIIDQGLTNLKMKQSFFQDQDKVIVAKAIQNKMTDLKSTDYLHFQYYFSAIQQILQDRNLRDLDGLRELLFEKLILIKPSHGTFTPLWTIYSGTLKSFISKERTQYFDFCMKRLREELQLIINQKVHYSQKGVAQFEAINKFTFIVRSFVQLLSSPEERQHVIEEILLQEETFTQNLESNCLPLKMFRDLFLQGGLGGFDVIKLMQDSKFVWLASVLLNVRHLPSLANFIEMKKQLIIFVDTEVVPVLINQAQNGNSSMILDIFSYMRERARFSMGYIHSIDYFLKKLIDPGEEFQAYEKPVIKVDEFKQIFKLVKIEDLNKDNEYSLDMLLFLRILKNTSQFIFDEKVVENLWKQSNQILNEFIANTKTQLSSKVAIALEIFQSVSLYLGEQSTKSLQNSLVLRLLSTSQSSIDSYLLNSVLDFIAHTLDSLGVTSFIDLVKSGKINFQSFLTWIFEVQRTQSLQPLTYIYMLQIIRKTLNAPELITDMQLIISQVIDIAKEHALTFENKLQRIQDLISQDLKVEKEGHKTVQFSKEEEEEEEKDQDEDETQILDFEYQMLQEIAETMVAMTNMVNQELNENDLYILISSGVEALQKAAYVLLKQLYENYIPQIKYKIEENEMIKQIKEEVDQQEDVKPEKEEQKGGDHYHHHEHQNYKNKLAFKNISDILIEIIENPPALNTDGTIHTQHVFSGSTQVENLIFQDTHSSAGQNQGVNPKVFGYLLAWNAMLTKIENGRIKSQLQGNTEYSQVLGALNEYLEENPSIYRMFLINLLAYLPEEKRGLYEAYNVQHFEPEYIDLSEKKASSLMAIFSLLNFMKSFPSLARKYYQECDKQLVELVMPYIKQIVSPAILENEIKKIEVAQHSLGQNELTFSLFKSTKEIFANFKKGEIEMTLKIKIPADYPLKLVEVDVSKQLKISEKQLRKWILSIRKIIQIQNGDIISAVLAWKANIEREIEGVEDCYICYCVVHETDQSLPKMPCKTCKNKFHVACIRKWFRQSHKSNCPICQNYFF